MRMGRSFLKLHGPQTTFKTKNSVLLVSALLLFFCHGTKGLLPTASTFAEPCCLEKGNEDHIPKDRRLSMHSGVFFLRSVRLTGLILICSLPSSSTPPTRDTRHFLRAALLFSAVPPRKTQKEHVQPHSHSTIEFAAENLLTDVDKHKLRSDQMWNRGKGKANAVSVRLFLHVTLHVHPLSKNFITYRHHTTAHRKNVL